MQGRSCARSPVADEADENVLERTLLCRKVAKSYSKITQVPEQRRDARMFGLDVESVFHLVATGLQPEMPISQCLWNFRKRLLQHQRQPFAAELLHQFRLLFDEDELALVDHADAVGHLFRFIDIMRGQY